MSFPLRIRKAVSSLIVILLIIVIAIVAVSIFTLGGIQSKPSNSGSENLGITSAYSVSTGSGGWIVYVNGKNSGNADARIRMILVNGAPYTPNSTYSIFYSINGQSRTPSQELPLSILIRPGQNYTIWFLLPANSISGPLSGKTFSYGQTIQINLITDAGNNYLGTLVLQPSQSGYERLGALVTGIEPLTNAWIIYLSGQNTGSSDAVINMIQINGRPYPISGNVVSAWVSSPSSNAEVEWNSTLDGNRISGANTLLVPSGASFNIQLYLAGTGTIFDTTFVSGQTIEITLITASGGNYPASAVLPESYSAYEKLGLTTQYAVSSGPEAWSINLGGQNIGSSDATITMIQINGVPVPDSAIYWCAGISSSCNAYQATSSQLLVPSGSKFIIQINLQNGTIPGKNFYSGQTIQVTLITAAGNNYPASVVLP